MSMTSLPDALNWASRVEPFEEWKAVSEAPWSRVYRLLGNRGHRYLKIMPRGQGSEIPVLTTLGGQECGHVPLALAQDRGLGLLLMADHQGRTKVRPSPGDLRTAVRAYVNLQRRSQEHQAELTGLRRLHAEAISALVDAFFSKDGLAWAVRYLPPGEFGLMAQGIAASEKRVRTIFAQATPLPLVLEHGDLHAGNLAFRPDGSVVIFDWADALWAPAGFSAPFLVGGVTAAAQQMMNKRQTLFGSYLAALVQQGYASMDMLCRSVRASMLAGLLRALSEFAGLKGADEKAKRFIGNQIRIGVNDLLNSVQV